MNSSVMVIPEVVAFIFGVGCIFRPKFGNFSRAMGLALVGLAPYIGNPESRSRIIGGVIAVAVAFGLAGIECLRRSPHRTHLAILGVASFATGLAILARAILLVLRPQ